MRTRIGTRLILGAGLVSAAVIGVMAALVVRIHTAQLVAERTRSASHLSETIKESTHFDMLENRRESLHRQIRAMGSLSQDGIRKVRLFNKEGKIMFSSDQAEIGTTLDTRAEACFACHTEGRPLERLDMDARSRLFTGGDGTRVLGIISPIHNQPSCATAACHAHSPKQSVLDVNVSMAEADHEIRRSRLTMAALAALAIVLSSLMLFWLNRRLVAKPVSALVAGTRQVAAGDLNTTIQVSGRHELGDLAAAFNDMTRRLADVQRQLTQADKPASVGRLAAGLAHEINNPLTGVLSYASLLRKRFEADPEACEDLDVVIRETKRCRLTLRELLDFARPTPPTRVQADLNEVARHAVAVVVNQPALNQVRLELDLQEDLPTAFADPYQIQQVVVNLLLNAADATGEAGGVLRLRSRAEGQAVVLEVEDDGPGIPAELQPHLFDPFFTTKGTRGTGLGLAVPWSIVQGHGGAIDVHSEPGQGARFTVHIPREAPGPTGPRWSRAS